MNKPGPSEQKTAPAVKRSGAGRRRHRWLPYLGAAILLALIGFGLWPQSAPVETARATVGALRATVNEEGKTRIKQRYVISAPVTGQLRRIPFKAGAGVQAGQTVLTVMDPVLPSLLDARSHTQAEARRDAAAANREKARASHDFAASELRRIEKLRAENSATAQELEAAQWREATAAKEETSADSALRQAEAELTVFDFGASAGTNSPSGPVEVKAPVSGRILRVFEESARVVATGTPLVEIGDPADLEAVIEVLSRDGAAIQPGAKVLLEQWGGGEPLAGQVRLVEPRAFTKISALGVEEQRVNVIADILTPLDKRPSLGDGFRVEARIVTWEASQALKVPSGALFHRGRQWETFVVANRRAQLRKVTAGRSSGTETQVLDGLKEGEEVILYPGDRIRDQQRVKQVKL